MKTKTVGQSLQLERQRKRISLERMAEVTHIRLEYLESLEADEFTQLPSAAYVRGFIAAYCQYLEIEAKPFLALLRRDFKETAKGMLVPRDFIKSVRPRKARWTPFTWLTIVLVLFFGSVITYIGIQWFRVTRPPTLVVTLPEQRAVVSAETSVEGFTESDAVIQVNDQPVTIQADGSFQTKVVFPVQGMGVITIQATDRAGKTSEIIRTVTVQF